MAPGALLSLLQVLESQVGDFSGEESCSIDGHAAAALREAEGNCGGDAAAGSTAPALHHLLASFGWDGRGFSRPLDARCLASRLKAFLFDGLSQQGSGSYSVVYRARSRVTGGSVMLKRLRLERSDEGLPSTAVREVSLLRELAGSPHIVQLLDVMWDHSRLYLVMEHLDCDLREHLDRCPAVRELPNVKSCMYQILKGMAHAHAHRVLHRDLKPQNILVDRATGCIKVADLGLARTFAPPIRPYTHEVVTLLYRAPEVLLGSPLYSTPLDVWSLGCILAELATGQPLFQGDSEIGQLLAIFQLLGTPGEPEWPGVSSMPDWSCHFPQWRPRDLAEAVPQLDPLGLDLLRQMLHYEPSQRIRCRQALAHPWFDDIRQAEEERSKALKQRVCEEQAHMRACIAAAASSSHLLSFSNEPSLTQQPSQASAQTGVSLPAGATSAGHC